MAKELLLSINSLDSFCRTSDFKGNDPYDTLNSFIPFNKSEFFAAVAIQLQKRNPVNIRPFLGIKKEYNPKGIGLLIKSYSILYQIFKKEEYIQTCTFLYNKLLELQSKGFSGACWGYNFDWASPGSYLERYTPSVVVTSFIIDGLMEYYKLNSSAEVKDLIISSKNYILSDLPITETS